MLRNWPRNPTREARDGKEHTSPQRKTLHRRHPSLSAAKRFRKIDNCLVQASCRSCQYINLDYETYLKEKHDHAVFYLRNELGIEQSRILPPVPAPKPLQYRALAKLAVRPHPISGEPVIGLFQPESHHIVGIEECPLQAPEINRFVASVKRSLSEFAIRPYDETSKSGDLRYLVVRTSHLTNELMVTFVVTAPIKLQLRTLVNKLKTEYHKISSAHMNVNQDPGNAIFHGEIIHLSGSRRLRERLCDFDLETSPQSFLQINPWQAINLYRRIEQVIGQNTEDPSYIDKSKGKDGVPLSSAWDLYCGVGQIALMAARAGFRALGIEENAQAISDARDNASRNNMTDRVEFLASRVEDMSSFPSWASAPKVIVVNPSRRGIAEEARGMIVKFLKVSPHCRFVYVSCDLTSLVRDLKDLLTSGFKIRQVEAFDMFPQTDKLEWIVVMTS